MIFGSAVRLFLSFVFVHSIFISGMLLFPALNIFPTPTHLFLSFCECDVFHMRDLGRSRKKRGQMRGWLGVWWSPDCHRRQRHITFRIGTFALFMNILPQWISDLSLRLLLHIYSPFIQGFAFISAEESCFLYAGAIWACSRSSGTCGSWPQLCFTKLTSFTKTKMQLSDYKI